MTPSLLQSSPNMNMQLGFPAFSSTRYSDQHIYYARLISSEVGKTDTVLLSEEKSDEQLMEAYRDGDIRAFDELFMKFKDILYRYLARQTGNMAIAEELFQEIWAAIIKNRHTYQVKSKFKTYLFHIAHNKLIDFYRSKQNSNSDILSYDECDNNNFIVDVNEQGPEHHTELLTKYEHLLTLLDKLPAAQRDVFLMHEEAGMTLIEIANVMDVSRDTIKSRLKYALQKLRSGMRHFA